MNILLVTNYFEPDQGASSIILTRLARKLSQRGHKVTVLTSLPNYPHGRILDGYRGKFVVVENRDGIRVIQTWLWATPSPRISRKLISQISFMCTAILRGLGIPRPDVVLIGAGQPMFTSIAGAFLSRIKRVPYVLDVHDLWPDHMLTIGVMTEKHPAYRAARWVVDAIYRGASRIVALHDALAAGVQKHIDPTDKIDTIYNGIDLNRFRPGLDTAAFRQKYDLGDEKLITFIGTFATPYDFDIMFAVMRHFKDRQDVRFVLMGTGSQSELVRSRLADDPSLAHVQWIGWIDHAEIPLAWCASRITFWALRGHDLYRGIFPAKSYEAMACGTPIAAAMEGLGADILNRSGGGLTVPFNDVQGLTQAVTRLVDDDYFHQECGQNARRYAEQHFDVEKSALAYEAALQMVIQQ